MYAVQDCLIPGQTATRTADTDDHAPGFNRTWRDAAALLPSILRTTAGRDLAVMLVVCSTAFAIAVAFDATERYLDWAHAYERDHGYQLDELLTGLALSALGFAWFAWRRWRQFRGEALQHAATLAELRQALQRARQADRAKSEFLATMNHELRTPLNSVIGFTEMIHGERFGPIGQARYKDYAGEVLVSARHLLAIVNDILEIAKAEGGGEIDGGLESLDALGAAHSVGAMLQTKADQRNVTLIVPAETHAQPLFAVANERYLWQVLLNLADNAIKFTPESGRVEIAVRPARLDDGTAAVEFAVSDTGIGMSEADVKVALTPFGQIHSGPARQFEGTGLGLPIATRLVERMGGKLAIDSTPGRGTTISFRLAAGHAGRAMPLAGESATGLSMAAE